MQILRTANAGVLLEIDGVKLLLDGVCGEIPPYSKTPENIKKDLYDKDLDVVAFTHFHQDHFDSEFAKASEAKGKKVLSPENAEIIKLKNLEIIPFKTRHIGKSESEHISFIIKGSKTIWFMGDAAPVTIKGMQEFPKPDVLFVPFAYLNSEPSLNITKSAKADNIILLHTPEREKDCLGIWENVEKTIINEENIYLINLGETLELQRLKKPEQLIWLLGLLNIKKFANVFLKVGKIFN